MSVLSDMGCACLSDNDGRTPLLWAALYGQESVVKLLVEWNDVEADFEDNVARILCIANNSNTRWRTLDSHSCLATGVIVPMDTLGGVRGLDTWIRLLNGKEKVLGPGRGNTRAINL